MLFHIYAAVGVLTHQDSIENSLSLTRHTRHPALFVPSPQRLTDCEIGAYTRHFDFAFYPSSPVIIHSYMDFAFYPSSPVTSKLHYWVCGADFFGNDTQLKTYFF